MRGDVARLEQERRDTSRDLVVGDAIGITVTRPASCRRELTKAALEPGDVSVILLRRPGWAPVFATSPDGISSATTGRAVALSARSRARWAPSRRAAIPFQSASTTT